MSDPIRHRHDSGRKTLKGMTNDYIYACAYSSFGMFFACSKGYITSTISHPESDNSFSGSPDIDGLLIASCQTAVIGCSIGAALSIKSYIKRYLQMRSHSKKPL